jgi:hypothetical protein
MTFILHHTRFIMTDTTDHVTRYPFITTWSIQSGPHNMEYSENCLVRPPPYGCKMGYSENCLVRPPPYGRKMGYSEICIVKPSPSVSKMWSFQYRFLKQVFINIENKEHDTIP